MSLFMQFTGNVVDSRYEPLTAYRYKGYHLESNTWSDWYNSNNESQYNFNLGDAAWLSQDGVCKPKDTIVIVVETLEEDPEARAFAMITFSLTTETTYINNVQLLKASKPNVIGLWGLKSPSDDMTLINDPNNPNYIIYSGRIGERIDVVQTFNDEHTWVYDNVKHYHFSTFLNMDIFKDRLGIVNVYYAWEENNYVADNFHVYEYVSSHSDNGIYKVTTKVRNKANKIAYDTIYIKIANKPPVLKYIWDPINPTIKDIFNITSIITDESSSLIKVSHYFDNMLIASNMLKEYKWEQSLGVKYSEEHVIKGVVVWSDGFSSKTLEVICDITMTNLLPTFSLSQDDTTADGSIIVKCENLEDKDGDTTKIRLRWELFFKTPLDNSYKEIFKSEYPKTPNPRVIEFPLLTAGEYKVICYAIDDAGGDSSNTLEFKLENDNTGLTTDDKVEWE